MGTVSWTRGEGPLVSFADGSGGNCLRRVTRRAGRSIIWCFRGNPGCFGRMHDAWSPTEREPNAAA
jgi:hypothetical protein